MKIKLVTSNLEIIFSRSVFNAGVKGELMDDDATHCVHRHPGGYVLCLAVDEIDSETLQEEIVSLAVFASMIILRDVLGTAPKASVCAEAVREVYKMIVEQKPPHKALPR